MKHPFETDDSVFYFFFLENNVVVEQAKINWMTSMCLKRKKKKEKRKESKEKNPTQFLLKLKTHSILFSNSTVVLVPLW